MALNSKLLIKHGFLSEKGQDMFPELNQKLLDDVKDEEKRKEIEEQIDKLSEDEAIEIADHHEIEITAYQMLKTNYPTPNVPQGDYGEDPMTYRIVWETFQRPVESFYFFLVEQFRDLGFSQIDKVTDIFAAAEQSSFYGVQQQRVGLHQDKVAQFLRGVSELIRQLFQIVREIRIIEERLNFYIDAKNENPHISEAAEIALKGLYVDLVEGGAKNAASVFGLARELQFTTLPDLFFSTHPKKKGDIKSVVDKLEFNRKVKEVLARKLYAYMNWKEMTEQEMNTRFNHTVKYLRQHYSVIQLYIQWIEPYLKQINRLSQDTKKLESPDMVAAFEGTMVEIELIGRYLPRGNSKYYAALVVNALYRTSPTMPFQQDYQRGPLHQGKIDITWRYYAWTEEDVQRFKSFKAAEKMQLISTIAEDIQGSMKELGKDMDRYLKIAEGKLKRDEKFEEKGGKKEEAIKAENILEVMLLPFKGFTDSFKALFPKGMFKFRGEEKEDKAKMEKERTTAIMTAKGLGWLHFRNFKKGHGLVTW